jgi:hypothetical protein
MDEQTWYVWQCKCGSRIKLNYDATEADYLRIKDCLCGKEFKWSHNYKGEE